MTAGGANRPTTLEYATLPMPNPRGKGFLVLCATILLPGLGPFIAGHRRRGLLWLAVALLFDADAMGSLTVPAFVPALLVLAPLVIVVHVWCWTDSFLCGRRSGTSFVRSPPLRYAIGIGLLVLSFILSPQVRFADLVKARVVEAFQTPTASMSPTLVPGDLFLCHKRLGVIRWRVVVINHPLTQSKQVTRLVGLPGETIEIIAGRVRVNGQPVLQPEGAGPYTSTWPDNRPFDGLGCEGNPITLGPDEYYFLSDNSPIAADSRHWKVATGNRQFGTLGRSDVVGVVTWTCWPPSRWRRFD